MAEQIWIYLKYTENEIELESEDNGKGADEEKLKYGFGLNAMKERIEAMGRSLELTPRFNKGVRLAAHPVDNIT